MKFSEHVVRNQSHTLLSKSQLCLFDDAHTKQRHVDIQALFLEDLTDSQFYKMKRHVYQQQRIRAILGWTFGVVMFSVLMYSWLSLTALDAFDHNKITVLAEKIDCRCDGLNTFDFVE